MIETLLRNRKKWDQHELDYLREHYYTQTPEELEAALHRPYAGIKKQASREGLTDPAKTSALMSRNRAEYQVNHDFFQVLTVENCYLAGLYAADGCVTGYKQRVINLTLHRNDRYLLEQIRDLLCPQKPVYDKKNTLASSLDFTSEQVAADLYRHFRITPAKSLTLEPPQLRERTHLLAFIKGVIDGDGTIGVYQGFIRLQVVGGSVPFLEWLGGVLSTLYPGLSVPKLQPAVLSPEQREKGWVGAWTLALNGTHAERVLEEMVALPTLELKRKWDVYRQYAPEKFHRVLQQALACPQCGQPFERKLSQIQRNQEGENYCSVACYRAATAGRDVQVELILQLHAEGHNTPFIARETGHSSATVARVLKEAGRAFRGQTVEWALPELSPALKYLVGYLHNARWDGQANFTMTQDSPAQLEALRDAVGYGTLACVADKGKFKLTLKHPERVGQIKALAALWDSSDYWKGRLASRGSLNTGLKPFVRVGMTPEEFGAASRALEERGMQARYLPSVQCLSMTGASLGVFRIWTSL